MVFETALVFETASFKHILLELTVNALMPRRFNFASPLVYLGISSYKDFFSDVNRAPLVIMLPVLAEKSLKGIGSVRYATTNDNPSGSAFLITFEETFEEWDGGARPRKIKVPLKKGQSVVWMV